MILSRNETRQIIEFFLKCPQAQAKFKLHKKLEISHLSEAKFYAGIVAHGLSLKLTNEEWFELLSRLPNRLLWSQLDLKKLLSQEQLRNLPPPTG